LQPRTRTRRRGWLLLRRAILEAGAVRSRLWPHATSFPRR
jgi:hypothetical protein